MPLVSAQHTHLLSLRQVGQTKYGRPAFPFGFPQLVLRRTAGRLQFWHVGWRGRSWVSNDGMATEGRIEIIAAAMAFCLLDVRGWVNGR